MAIKIEDYRGFEIQFEPQTERFTYSTDGSSWSQKQSYSACKKAIDDYLKDNANFKAFKIRHRDYNNVHTVIGMRKDNRFIIVDEKGKKDQISEYNESDFILYNEEDEKHYAQIALYELEEDELRKKKKDERAKVSNVTLKSVKNNYTY